jgi:hypothetical protein
MGAQLSYSTKLFAAWDKGYVPLSMGVLSDSVLFPVVN